MKDEVKKMRAYLISEGVSNKLITLLFGTILLLIIVVLVQIGMLIFVGGLGKFLMFSMLIMLSIACLGALIEDWEGWEK